MKLIPSILMTAAAILALLAAIVWVMNQTLPPSQHDLHDRLKEASKPGERVLQVQLAHVGHIDTPDGRFEVAVEFNVLKGMLSARGVKKILLFSPDGTVAQWMYSDTEPMWCKGSRIYLDNYLGLDVRIDPVIQARHGEDSMPSGNVLDFSAGLDDPLLTEDHSFAAAATVHGGS